MLQCLFLRTDVFQCFVWFHKSYHNICLSRRKYRLGTEHLMLETIQEEVQGICPLEGAGVRTAKISCVVDSGGGFNYTQVSEVGIDK